MQLDHNDNLFSSSAWSDFARSKEESTRKEIERLDSNYIASTSTDDLCEYFDKKNDIHIPQLNRLDINVAPIETKRVVQDYGQHIEILAHEIEVNVPYDGPGDSFFLRPTSWRQKIIKARVNLGTLTFYIDCTNTNEQHAKEEIEKLLDVIEENLSNLRKDAAQFKSAISASARRWIEDRRAKVMKHRALASSLGYKLKAREDTPATHATPALRRKITPRLPPQGKNSPPDEPVLIDDDYEHILSILGNMAIVMEHSPSAFKTLDEEALRFLFLVPLNGHYEGTATGETFNFEGKTDILIKSGGRNIFIAECKFWAGPQKLIETIDQLLKYASWRDTKTSIILFNKNKHFSKVLEAIPSAVKEHPNFVRSLGRPEETQFRYIFSHRDDPQRHLTLTLLAFDVPRPSC